MPKLVELDITLLEPESVLFPSNTSAQVILAYSTAISLKRIADAITGDGLEDTVRALGQVPMNSYGEGLAEAIQNAIERGLRGISSHG